MTVRRVCAVVAVAVLTLSPLGTVGSHAADDASVLSAYGGDASGTSVHALGATNALTNFRTGFIDNSYPLATAHLDAAPAAQGTASIADTGPLGGVAVSQAPTVIQQPQYALATYPGESDASRSQAGTVAEARATETGANAHSAIAAAGETGAVEHPGDVLHTSADDATSRVVVDRTAGTIDASAVGHASHASFGGGALVLDGVDVRASVTASATGTAKATPRYALSIASASVNGTPVAITDKGVVAAEPVAGSDAATAALNQQLNQALAGAGLKVFVTAPTITTSGAQATVAVTGVHVVYTAPAPDPSVPTLSLEYIVGEARAFGFVVPGDLKGVTAPEPEVAPVVSGVDLGSSTGAIEPVAPVVSPAVPGAVTVSPGRAIPVTYRRPRPTWLVPLYVAWQVLVLLTAGALVWARRVGDG